MMGAVLVQKNGMIKVCRLIDRKYYCIEFEEDVKAKELVDYWSLNDVMFKKLGRPTELKD